jgi:two-component system response regulator YesN
MAVSLMVVDDEHLVRQGIRHLLKDVPEFEVIATAENGRRAVEMASELNPEIILMDVRMPVMDGLEALERIRGTNPLSKVVILSGHSDFQYAQQALKLGASDYLLKPVSPDDLLAVLRRLKKLLADEAQQSASGAELRTRLDYSMSAFMEQFFLQLLNSDVPREEMAEKLGVLGMREDAVSVILVGLDHSYRLKTFSSEEAYKEIVKTLGSFLERHFSEGRDAPQPVLSVGNGVFALLYFGSFTPEPREFAISLMNAIKAGLPHSVSIALGTRRRLPEAAKSCAEASDRLKQRVLLGGGRVLSEDPGKAARTIEYPREIERKIMTALRYGDSAQVKCVLRQLITALEGQKIPPEGWQQVAFDIMEQGFQVASQLGIPPGSAGFRLEKSREISELTTGADIELWLWTVLSGISSAIGLAGTGPSLAVKRALSYIDSHSAENIRLVDVATQVSLSANYLSQLMRQETGKTFLEHLCLRRIEEAKRLLAGSLLKVSEIAYKVGFNNPRYFSEVFRVQTGTTPRLYRRIQASDKS